MVCEVLVKRAPIRCGLSVGKNLCRAFLEFLFLKRVVLTIDFDPARGVRFNTAAAEPCWPIKVEPGRADQAVSLFRAQLIADAFQFHEESAAFFRGLMCAGFHIVRQKG